MPLLIWTWQTALAANVEVTATIIEPLTRGEPSAIEIVIDPPLDGVLVHAILGLGGEGPGPCPMPLEGTCLDVQRPLERSSEAWTTQGLATVELTPLGASGDHVALQAVAIDGLDASTSSPSIVSVAPPPWAVHVSPSSPRAYAQDLRCEITGTPSTDVSLYWQQNGERYVGPVRPNGDVTNTAVKAGDVFTCVAVSQSITQRAEATVRVPSVLVVLADDLGWGETSTFGDAIDVATPQLDQLAEQGIIFNQAYVSAPICGPSRAALMTGRMQQRFGFEYNIHGRLDRGLPEAELTLADYVQGRARTALIGKWHLGSEPPFQPNQRGFQTFVGLLAGRTLSIDPSLPGVIGFGVRQPDIDELYSPSFDRLVRRNREPADWNPEVQHLTDFFADAAIEQMLSSSAPFMTVLTFNAPHLPLQATPEHIALVDSPSPDPDVLVHQATVAALDAAIGRVWQAIQASSHGDDTLVIVLSDNGCDKIGSPHCSNAPLQGTKGTLTEGGLRVPMTMWWPDRFSPGVYEPMVSSLDLVPTITAAMNVPMDQTPPLDGVSLLPFLQDPLSSEPAHEVLYWRLGDLRAVRQGRYKLVEHVTENLRWLFDVDADPSETVDLSDSRPNVVQALHQLLVTRDAFYVQPLWPRETQTLDYYGDTVTISW